MRRLAKGAVCAAAVLLGAFTMLAATADYSDARGIRGTTAGSIHRGGGGVARGGGARAGRGYAGRTQFASAAGRGPVRGGEISRSGQMAQRGMRPGGDWASTGAAARTDYNRQRFDNRANFNRRDGAYNRRDTAYNRRDANYYRRDVTYNDIDVNVDRDWHSGWGWDGYHPVAAGVAYGTAAAVTAAAIGSVVYSLPPSCAAYPHYGYTYYRCGDVWYQPQYSGDQVTYIVVEQPG